MQTRDYAIDLGIALQLTNIIRDVAPDLERGRVYLPLEDLRRFGCTEDDLRAGRRDRATCGGCWRFKCERAQAVLSEGRRGAAAGTTSDGWWRRASWARSTSSSCDRSSAPATTCSGSSIRVPRPRQAVIAALHLAEGHGAAEMTMHRPTSSSSAPASPG